MDTMVNAMLPDLFMAKIRVLPNGCWEWLASRNRRSGHGYFNFAGRTQIASTFAWEWVNGPVPDGWETDHYLYPNGGCIGPACANWEHVRPVTHRENSLRGNGVGARNLAKTHCPKGHEYSRENTIVRSDRVNRICRICDRERKRRARLVTR